MYLFYVNMQKRGDGKVYPDLHKTDGKIYFTPEEAQAAIDADPELAPYRHVVEIGADLPHLIPSEPYFQVWDTSDYPSHWRETSQWEYQAVAKKSPDDVRVLFALPDNT